MGGFFINKMGRKIILIGGDIVCGISLGLLALFSKMHENNKDNSSYSLLIVILIFLYSSAFGMSLGPVVWIYNAEILSEAGISFATAVNWLCTIIVTFTFPILSDYSMPLSFLIFGGCCALGLVFLLTMIKETKGLNAR